MHSFDDALKLILTSATPLDSVLLRIDDALGHVLAEPATCEGDLPAFDNSAMDGFAVIGADVQNASEHHPVRLDIIGEVFAGDTQGCTITSGTAAKIMTGAPVPTGADAVIPVEDTRQEGRQVIILAAAKEGQYIRRKAEELHDGETVMPAGILLGPAEVGILAAIGRTDVRVIRKPKVAFFVTGDELIEPSQPLTKGSIRDVNTYTLAASLESLGVPYTNLGRIPDERQALLEAIQKAEGFDVLITSGSVSMGERDILRACLQEAGMKELFYKINIKPGKPVLFGLLNQTRVFCLPGNTVSTLVTFLLLVRPALLQMQGRGDIHLREVTAFCGVEIHRRDLRQEYIRVSLRKENDVLKAFPTGNQGSSILSSFLNADGLMVIPAGKTHVSQEEVMKVLLLR